MSDRELMKALGLSKSGVTSAKRGLVAAGYLTYEVTTKGTLYTLTESALRALPSALPSALKTGRENSNTLYIVSNSIEKEREKKESALKTGRNEGQAGAVEQGSEVGQVYAVWLEHNGRVMLAKEQAELAEFVAAHGASRMIEIIETAWDRCTANGMSMFYLRKMVGLLTARQPVAQSKAKTKAWTPRTEARVKEALSKPSEVSEFGEIRDTEPKPWDKYSARGGFT